MLRWCEYTKQQRGATQSDAGKSLYISTKLGSALHLHHPPLPPPPPPSSSSSCCFSLLLYVTRQDTRSDGVPLFFIGWPGRRGAWPGRQYISIVAGRSSVLGQLMRNGGDTGDSRLLFCETITVEINHLTHTTDSHSVVSTQAVSIGSPVVVFCAC